MIAALQHLTHELGHASICNSWIIFTFFLFLQENSFSWSLVVMTASVLLQSPEAGLSLSFSDGDLFCEMHFCETTYWNLDPPQNFSCWKHLQPNLLECVCYFYGYAIDSDHYISLEDSKRKSYFYSLQGNSSWAITWDNFINNLNGNEWAESVRNHWVLVYPQLSNAQST